MTSIEHHWPHPFRYRWPIAGACWLLGVLGLWIWMTAYQYRTESTGATALSTAAAAGRQRLSSWPDDSSLALADDGFTLLFFMHPKCPCTRASARQLQRLLDGTRLTADQRPRVLVIASHPRLVAPSWWDTDTVRLCSQLPRTTVIPDPAGVETQRFGSSVSGTVMLFDSAGRRLFSGGITASRGLEGDSVGGDTLQQLLTEAVSGPQTDAPAFGCQLCHPAEPAAAVGHPSVPSAPAQSAPAPSAPAVRGAS